MGGPNLTRWTFPRDKKQQETWHQLGRKQKLTENGPGACCDLILSPKNRAEEVAQSEGPESISSLHKLRWKWVWKGLQWGCKSSFCGRRQGNKPDLSFLRCKKQMLPAPPWAYGRTRSFRGDLNQLPCSNVPAGLAPREVTQRMLGGTYQPQQNVSWFPSHRRRATRWRRQKKEPGESLGWSLYCYNGRKLLGPACPPGCRQSGWLRFEGLQHDFSVSTKLEHSGHGDSFAWHPDWACSGTSFPPFLPLF